MADDMNGHKKAQERTSDQLERIDSDVSTPGMFFSSNSIKLDDHGAEMEAPSLSTNRSSILSRIQEQSWSLRKKIAPEGTCRDRLLGLALRASTAMLEEGLRETLVKAWRRLRYECLTRRAKDLYLYKAWMASNEPGSEEMECMQQGSLAISSPPLIAVLVAVKGRNADSLKKPVESVLDQQYGNWNISVVSYGGVAPVIQDAIAQFGGHPQIRVANSGPYTNRALALNMALANSSGEIVCVLGQDDELAPWALLEVEKLASSDPAIDLIYSDEDRFDADGSRHDPFFKPGFSPDLLMSMNYIGHLVAIRRKLIEEIGGFRDGFPGAEEYDLIVRAAERARKVARIPKVLYHVRELPREARYDATTKQSSQSAQAKVIEDALSRRGRPGKVEQLTPSTFKVKYVIEGNPLVSIIIPAKNKAGFTKRCIGSIEKKSTYRHFEIIVVDNGSTQLAAKKYLDSIRGKPNRLVLDFPEAFNYSRMNNFAAKHARGDFLLFLNNDTEVITRDWLEEMTSHAQRKEVGAVGAKLLYPGGRVQHGGVILGIGETAGHAFYGMRGDNPGYMGLASVVRNCSAVTAACMMVRRRVYEEAGGFDESFSVAFNDVDLCLRLGKLGYSIVYTPHIVLYHYEGKTRGEHTPPIDTTRFKQRWDYLRKEGDMFYSPNLSLDSHGFDLRWPDLQRAAQQ